MATTRMRVHQSVEVLHKIPTSGDQPEVETSTLDTAVQGLGGNVDFQIDSGVNVAYNDVSKVQDINESKIGGTATITKFIYIKHTGFKDAAKTLPTPSTEGLAVALGGPWAANPMFQLFPGESLLLHDLNSNIRDIALFYLDAATDDIYVEIVYL